MFALLAFYATVSAGFGWLDNRMSSRQDTMDDIFANILNDFNVDISFQTPKPFMFPNAVQDENDYFVDDSPSSMFNFPSFGSFGSFFNDQPMPFQRRASDPLYLMVQSAPNMPMQQNYDSDPTSIFVLEQSGKVNGDTYRYTVRSNGNKIVTESWSTPKMYLCDSLVFSVPLLSLHSISQIGSIPIYKKIQRKSVESIMAWK